MITSPHAMRPPALEGVKVTFSPKKTSSGCLRKMAQLLSASASAAPVRKVLSVAVGSAAAAGPPPSSSPSVVGAALPASGVAVS